MGATPINVDGGSQGSVKKFLWESHFHYHASAALLLAVVSEWCPGMDRVLANKPSTNVMLTIASNFFIVQAAKWAFKMPPAKVIPIKPEGTP